MNNHKISIGQTIAIGFMLFALFFGAGNLIFPPALGQAAGEHFWPAIVGFLLTGVGLPLLGVLALGLSGHNHVQSMANKINPVFSLLFTVILYLCSGLFFASPRTCMASYKIAIAPFLPDRSGGFDIGLFIYSILYFAIVGWVSLKPGKIVDRVGKILTPALLLILFILLTVTFVNPIDRPMEPVSDYIDNAFVKGFQEGYLTLDTLASFVFGIVVIRAIKDMGVTDKKGIAASTIKSGLIACGCLGAIYIGLGYLGNTTNVAAGEANNGPQILTFATNAHFGVYGNLILGLAIFFACLTTAIGVIASCATYFEHLLPKLSYRQLAVIFTVFSATAANIGLNQLIAISVPVLFVLYPIAIVLIVLTLTEPLFKGRLEVYRWSLLFTGIFSIFDGINVAGIPVGGFTDFLTKYLPLFSAGMGWLVPALAGAVIGLVISLATRPSDSSSIQKAN